LVVSFTGLKNSDEFIIIALCNSYENYIELDSPFIGKNIKLKDNFAIVEFTELPFGDYAIKTFHNENSNSDLDTNMFGMPTEDYGFSNNARGIFGPPSWKDAKFKFYEANKIMEIQLK